MIGTPLLFSTFLLAAGSGSVGCIIYASKGTYRPTLNKLLLASGISIMLWSLGLAVRVSAANIRAAAAGSFIAPLGYSMLFGFLLHYVLILTGHRIGPGRKWLYLFLYLPGVLTAAGLSVFPLFGRFPFVLVRTSVGWVNETWNQWIWFYYAYYCVFLAIITRLLHRWGKEAGPGIVRMQAKSLLDSILMMAALGTLTDVLPDFVKIQMPGIAVCFASFPILAICYGVRRLNFMVPERPDPDEVILNKASRAKSIYIILGLYFVAGSLLNLLSQTVFSDDHPAVPGVLLFSGLLLACGAGILLLSGYLYDDGVKELALAFVFAFFIPLITFRFAQFGSITVWTFAILLLVPGMLFNRRILLVTTLHSLFTTQLVLMGTAPRLTVQVDASDYIIRLGLISLMAFLCFFVTLIYRSRLRENIGHSRRQTAAAAVSQSLLAVNPDNWENKMAQALERCSAVFPFDRACFVLFSDDGEAIREFCEAATEEGSDSDHFSDALKKRFFTSVRRCLADRKVFAFSEESGNFQGCEEFQAALENLHLKSAVAAAVLTEGSPAGFLCFGTSRTVRAWPADQISFLQIISNIFADTLTKLKALQKEQFLAYHDQLTGLPNRLLLTDRLRKSMPLADRRAKMIGVVFLDFDSFKSVNDTMGHELGDQLLIRLSNLISGCVRKYDTVARFGGDEFVLILDQLSSTGDLLCIIDKIMSAIRRPIVLQGLEFFMTGSAGVALYPQDGRDAETLISNADIAMYHAKSTGKNRYALCSQDMKDEVVSRMQLTNLLYRAQELNQLAVYYQPQVDLATNEITGLEALLRWKIPDKGMISPGTFIPLAEKTGLIQPIGRWVLETACRQSRKWQERGFAPVRMAVNVSVQQLYAGNFTGQVAQVLQSAGLAPELLELEVTESVASSGAPNILKIFSALKNMGISLSVDDFGTEYSSLNRLKLLPVDRLKLDIQFVRGLENSERDRAIAKTIILLAKNLKMKVTAEGVETKAQLEYLSEKLCDEVQGFYYYKPMPAEEVEKYLHRISDTLAVPQPLSSRTMDVSKE